MAPTIDSLRLDHKTMPFAGDTVDGVATNENEVAKEIDDKRREVVVEKKRLKIPRRSRKHKKVGCLCLPGEVTYPCAKPPKLPSIQENDDDSTPSIPSFPKPLSITDAKLDPQDTHYVTFFVFSMPQTLPYHALFPHVVEDIFLRSIQNSLVRHSILSISSSIIDFRLHRSMDRFYYQYITSLSLIRNSLAENKIDESLAIAVFLVAWIDVVRGKLDTTRKHLTGLRLIIQTILKTRKKLTGILLQIWWISIKFDWSASLYLVEQPIFPIVPDTADEVLRKWIGSAVLSEETEWALAAFTLENLMHKACHYASMIHSMRCDPDIKVGQVLKKVNQVVEILETESRNWVNRPIIQAAAQQELTARSLHPSFTHDSEPSQFLSFPPLQILNVFYANLLNSWRGLQIYVSLIRVPEIGPSPPRRLTHAIEICRTWCSLGDDKSTSEAGKVWIMFLVGVAFGGKRSGEMGGWIKERLEETSKRLPILRKGVDIYGELWEVEGDFWNELEKRRRALLQ